ncbi:MAG: ORF6N domain-containing protein [Deltaproteobacteria bacterium]|nr:ORF6N domain-containing protein [Deltaproteobacteria bacterium]
MPEQVLSLREISNKIFVIRGQRVMLDNDLAELYEVETKYLNRVVKRNLARFPSEFMFQLTFHEVKNLRFQIGTSSSGEKYGGRRYLPYAFTEHGVAMLSSVLRSEKAVQVNISIIKTFVKLREMMESSKDLAKKLNQLEQKCDRQFTVVFDAIREIMNPTISIKRRKIGFAQDE